MQLRICLLVAAVGVAAVFGVPVAKEAENVTENSILNLNQPDTTTGKPIFSIYLFNLIKN